MATTMVSPEAGWSKVITDTNHGALVSITAWLMLVAGLMFLGIRLAIRMPWRKLLGRDDYMTIFATVLAMIHTIAVLYAVKHGLGRHVNDVLRTEGNYHLEKMSRAIYIGEIFLVFGVMCSKLAVTLLFVRLASGRNNIRPAWVLTGAIVVWGIASVIGVGVSSPFRSIEVPDHQEPWPRSWVAIAATNVALEIALFIYPIYLVWDLQMSWRSKATVIVGFALRLPTSVIAFMRLVSLIGASRAATDISWTYVRSAIYTEIEMHYSLIAATIPCMHIFLRHLQTGYLSTTADQFGTEGHDSRRVTKNESYALYSSSLSAENNKSTTPRNDDTTGHDEPTGCGFDFGEDFPRAGAKATVTTTTTTTTTTIPAPHLHHPTTAEATSPNPHQHADTCPKGNKEIVLTEGGWELRPSGCGGTSTTQVTHSQHTSEGGSVTSDGSDSRIIIRKTVDVRYDA